MKESNGVRYYSILRLVKLANMLLMTLIFAVGMDWCYLRDVGYERFSVQQLAMIGLFALLYTVYGKVYDAFLISVAPISAMVYSQALAALISDGVMLMIFWFGGKAFPKIRPMLVIFVCQLLAAALWSGLANTWYYRTYLPKSSVIVYDMRGSIEDTIVQYGLDRKFQVKQSISAEECLEQNMKQLEGVDAVFLCGIHSHDRNIILKYCVQNEIRTYLIPCVGDLLMSNAKTVHLCHLPMLSVNRFYPTVTYRALKRVFDIIASGLALVLLSPIMIVTAIAIKSADGGPVFYKQRRLTMDRREFNVLKFRSMRVDAEKDGVARLSSGEDDPRITKVGRIIRATRIDELPQLINIIKGDMSLVGPRPERPQIAKQYEEMIPEFALRLQVKAGLTGYAQVYGKYNTEPYDKLLMDLMYITSATVWTDLRIIFATIKILFTKDSTEGVAEGQITAAKRR